MASSSSSSSSSSPSSSPPKHDVFLSFRSEDTGKNFTSYLFDALCRKQIETFIDDHELRRGDEISPSLRKAIQGSSISIIIFSENYASSTWCLNEILEILECLKTRGQIVVPVFYSVTPSDIRKQTGTYKKAFDEHERSFKKANDKVQKWRAALTQVANLSGWDLDQNDGTESEFVENIAKDVLKRLNHISSSDCFDGLVGITSRMESIESLLCMGMENIVRIIGIWGMGGIGKTTIARALLLRIANQFECHCFLENVKDIARYGPNHLQEKLLFEIFEDRNVRINAFTLNRLRRKKVLIVLDDVDDLDHLDFLVRGHSSFGGGSRIIITSRDKQVLKNGVDELYELEELNYDEAFQLFSANAFKQNHPPENYVELSNRAIYYASGNPLALKVLGRFLFDRNMLEWKNSLKKLKRYPNLNIQNVLKISYDGLDYHEKEIFLSIACFFKGENKDRVAAILDNCGLFADIGIAVLIDKCLITVRHDLLQMHDLMQEMGRGIVLQESFNEPGKRSRLWDAQDILDLFKRNTGTRVVESISLDLSQIREQLHLSPDAFMRMRGLKFLKFHEDFLYEDNQENKLHLNQGLELLPDELRYLHWHRYPLKSLPSNFKPDHLVELEMRYSNIKQLWKEDQPLENLRRIDLSYSEHLTEAPYISQVPNLEFMVLKGCSSLTKFPRIPCNMKDLHLSFTAIEEIPQAIGSLKKLVTLKLDNCTRLKNLPRSIRHLTSLTLLDLHGCPSITEFPETPVNVEDLHLGDTGIEEVPSSVEQLTKLSGLSLRGCNKLKRVSRGIFKLEFLNQLSLEGCSKLDDLVIDEEEVPSSVELLPRLSQLDLRYCKNVESFPILLCNLRSLYSLDLSGYSGVDKMLDNLPLSSLSSLCSLKDINLSECNLLVLPCALSYLSSLTDLDLSGNNFEILSLKPFSSVSTLRINYCERLRSLQDFPVPSCLEMFEAHNCILLETLPTSNVFFTGKWDIQQKFRYFNCFNLDETARINILADARLRSQLMANNMQKKRTLGSRLSSHCVCFPESEIPEWIKDQNEGSSVTINLPPNWYNNKFFGFTTSIVATFEGDLYDSLFFVQWICKFIDYDGEPHVVLCHVDYQTVGDPHVHSDHLYLATPNSDRYDVYEEGDVIGESSSSLEKFSSCQKALFQFFIVDTEMYTLPNYEIKKCGVSPLYAGDVESIESHVDSSTDGTAEVCVDGGRDGISNEEENLNLEPILEPQVNEPWNCSFGSCFSFLFQRWS